MPKQDVNADRAAKLIEALKQQREQGTTYPLTVARLASWPTRKPRTRNSSRR